MEVAFVVLALAAVVVDSAPPGLSAQSLMMDSLAQCEGEDCAEINKPGSISLMQSGVKLTLAAHYGLERTRPRAVRHIIRQLPEPRSEDSLLDEDCKDHACADAAATINKASPGQADGGHSAPDGAQLRSDPLADLVDTFEDVRPEPLVSDPRDAIRPVPKGCMFYWATLLDVAAGAAAVAGFFFVRELGNASKSVAQRSQKA